MLKAGLRGIDLKLSYNSDFEDVSREFFNPVLKEAVLYERVSGYFSSSSLGVISEGLSSLMWTGGEARIIIGVVVSQEDLDSIKKAKTNVSKPLRELFATQDELKSMMVDKNVEAFAKLLESNALKVKFAIVGGEGIFHMKYGIVFDKDKNSIAFSGSLNETGGALSKNVEEFNTFRSWIPGQWDYVSRYISEFETYWSGESVGRAIIADMPENIAVEIASAYNSYKANMGVPKKTLWGNQKTAISKWEENGMHGIVEMATGTGKTLMALNAVQLAQKHCGHLLVIVAVPTDPLRSQWQRESLSELRQLPIIIKDSKSIDDLEKKIKLLGHGGIAIAIGTYSILSGEKFQKFISSSQGNECMLIADEVHWSGSPTYSSILKPQFNYRLGISATPVRYMDEPGTDLIERYFEGIVFSYPVRRAISDGRICRYSYFPIFSALSAAEMEEYENFTRKYARALSRAKANELEKQAPMNILTMRSRILKKASSKISAFEKIAQRLKSSASNFHAIVFYEDKEQMEAGNEVLSHSNLNYYTFDSRNNAKEREAALKFFKSGSQSFLCTIRAADEGIDIPDADIAIIFSETGNPRQAWQRLGRVLRNASGKGMAKVFEISVIPEKALGTTSFELERGVAIKEIKRMCILCSSAENRHECATALAWYGEQYGVDAWKYLNEAMYL